MLFRSVHQLVHSQASSPDSPQPPELTVWVVEAVVDKVARQHLDSSRRGRAVGDVLGRDEAVVGLIWVWGGVERVGDVVVAGLVALRRRRTLGGGGSRREGAEGLESGYCEPQSILPAPESRHQA